MSVRVHPIADEALGNRSYIVEVGGGEAVAVDPRRDTDDLLALAARAGVRVVAALETHLHADFVSGAREVAAATGAEIVAAREAGLVPAHRGVAEGDTLAYGDAVFRVWSTPGHTPEHLAFVAEDRGGQAVAVFSGGSLIAGGAARTDLTGAHHTDALSRAQFGSLRRIASLPDAVALHPTHGGGSFCSTGPAQTAETTVGAERRANPLLAFDDEDAFVRHLLSGFGTYPAYFAHLREVNRAGPRPVAALEPPMPLSPEVVSRLVAGGAWLVDARGIEEWARLHPRGAVSIALRPAFASWLGWVVPFGSPVVLLVAPERLGEAVTLARGIGYDRVLGSLEGGVEAWARARLPTGSVDVIEPEEARVRRERGAVLLDVRQDSEVAGGRAEGALHIEGGDVASGKTPDGPEVVTYCAHGERAATAASLLEARGLRVANLRGGFGAWRRAGLPVRT